MEPIIALHHISLTVRDLDASVAWYKDLFELTTMMDEEHEGGRAVVLMHPDTHVFLGLHAHDATGDGAFSETRVGSTTSPSRCPTGLPSRSGSSASPSAGSPHSEIKDRNHGSIVTLRDPDNIQLERYAPPSA